MVFSECSAQPTPAVSTELCHSEGPSEDRPRKEKSGLESLVSAPSMCYSDHSRARTLRAKAVVHTTLSCLVHTYTLVPQSLVHSLSDPDPTPFQCSPELQSQRQHLLIKLFFFFLSLFHSNPGVSEDTASLQTVSHGGEPTPD